jgi:hypothetical protein
VVVGVFNESLSIFLYPGFRYPKTYIVTLRFEAEAKPYCQAFAQK